MRRFLCIAVLFIVIASPATAVVNLEIDRSDLSYGRMSGPSAGSIAYRSMFGSAVNVLKRTESGPMHVPTAFGPHYVPGGLSFGPHYVPGGLSFGPHYVPGGLSFGPHYVPSGLAFGPHYVPGGLAFGPHYVPGGAI